VTEVGENRAEDCHAKHRGLRECNPAIPYSDAYRPPRTAAEDHEGGTWTTWTVTGEPEE
jgi:hypothetical protein